jgi:hypothetical protein
MEMDPSLLVALGGVAVAGAAATIAVYQAAMAKRQARSTEIQADVGFRALTQQEKASQARDARDVREALLGFSQALADINTTAALLINKYRKSNVSTFDMHEALKFMYAQLRYVRVFADASTGAAEKTRPPLVDEALEAVETLVERLRDLRPQPVISVRHREAASLLKIVDQIRNNHEKILKLVRATENASKPAID